MRPHKNAKNGSGSPYVRIKKSILVQIENEAKASKPMHVFDKVYEDCGGVVGAESCRSVLRNKNQVSSVKRSIKKEPGDADPLFAVMEECKKQQSHADPFIRAVKAAPEASAVCGLSPGCFVTPEDLANDHRFGCLLVVWDQAKLGACLTMDKLQMTVGWPCHLADGLWQRHT